VCELRLSRALTEFVHPNQGEARLAPT
jgi:hypothetical protein